MLFECGKTGDGSKSKHTNPAHHSLQAFDLALVLIIQPGVEYLSSGRGTFAGFEHALSLKTLRGRVILVQHLPQDVCL